MDKSFNDQELSDIMKEIEALEEDFHEEEASKPTAVLQELSEMPEQKAIPLKPVKSEPVVAGKSPATMCFKVSGDLQLDLEFDISGKSVSLQIAEEGLTITLEGGMTFKVPVTDKKAA